MTQLRIVLDRILDHRTSQSLYYELDSLYHVILDANPDHDAVLLILATVLVLPGYLKPSPANIELVLGLPSGQVALTLRAMYSVLDIRGAEDAILVHHTSFRDYLGDPARSRGFHIDIQARKIIIARKWLQKLTASWMRTYGLDEIEDERIASFFTEWIQFCVSIPEPTRRLLDDLRNVDILSILFCYCAPHPSQRTWSMYLLGHINVSPDWKETSDELVSWIGKYEENEIGTSDNRATGDEDVHNTGKAGAYQRPHALGRQELDSVHLVKTLQHKFSTHPRSFHLERSPGVSPQDDITHCTILLSTTSKRGSFLDCEDAVRRDQVSSRLLNRPHALRKGEEPGVPEHLAYQDACVRLVKAVISDFDALFDSNDYVGIVAIDGSFGNSVELPLLWRSGLIEAKEKTVEQQAEDGPQAESRHTLGEKELLRFQALFEDPQNCRTVLEKWGNKAQGWLDTFYALWIRPGILWRLRSTMHVAVLHLSRQSEMYPKCPRINNVEKLGSYPVASGGFGDVWKGRIADEIVCLKVVKVYLASDVKQLLREYMQEASVCQQLRHPNLLPFMGMYHLGEGREYVCLVSPWMERGNLVTFLKNTAPEHVDRMLLAYDVASGLAHLHGMKIVHGDMKGVNVLITLEGRASIGDFGLSHVADSHALKLSTSFTGRARGTTRWLAPELLRSFPPSVSTVQSDMYAYGCVCYEIFAGRVPFGGTEAAVILAVMVNMEHPSRPEGLKDDAIWELMTSCWNFDSSLRPTAADFCEKIRRLSSSRGVDIQDAPDWKSSVIEAIQNSVEYPPLDELELLSQSL
ncbi:Rho guanine nucleotide exchange factor [Marasmius tenuissimus]|nr:Rho guanine nucleotide exchange factor [Marasmius tenuissimus]